MSKKERNRVRRYIEKRENERLRRERAAQQVLIDQTEQMKIKSLERADHLKRAIDFLQPFKDKYNSIELKRTFNDIIKALDEEGVEITITADYRYEDFLYDNEDFVRNWIDNLSQQRKLALDFSELMDRMSDEELKNRSMTFDDDDEDDEEEF